MQINRQWAMPNANTFSITPIKELIETYIKVGGVVIDPFANKSKYGTITNDLNPAYATTYHMDALAFLEMLGTETGDLILYDPPYSFTQAAQLYASYGKDKLEVSVANMRYWSKCKDEIARVCKCGGKVICCGWNTNGIGNGRGFDLDEVLIVAHGGGHNDTLVTVETKLTHQITLFDLLEDKNIHE